VKLKWVVGGQGDTKTPGEVVRQWVSMVTEKKSVVAQRRHSDANLGQVVEVLKHGDLHNTKCR